MPKPNFTGTWKFNPSRSTMQITPPDSATFIIEHTEPLFNFSRTHVFGTVTDELTIKLNTNGAPVVSTVRDLEVHSTLCWERNTLLFISTFPALDKEASNTVRYRIEDNGKTIVAEEKLRSSKLNYDNIWILEKQ